MSSAPDLRNLRHKPQALTNAITAHFADMLSGGAEVPEKELNWVRNIVKKGDCVVDVGANFGLWSARLAALTESDGTVYAFEPFPETYAILLGVLDILGYLNNPVVALPMALNDSPTFMHIDFAIPPPKVTAEDLGDEYGLPHGLGRFAGPRDWETVCKVPAMALDAYPLVSGPIQFVKIDVEGAELAVLQGMVDLLRASLPPVLVEVEQRHYSDGIWGAQEPFRLLRSLGYTSHFYDSDVDRLIPAEGLIRGENNYIFIAEAP